MRKGYSILFTVLLLHFSKFAHSQREAENWVYGSSVWLNFSTGQPVQQSQIPVSQIFGSTCMSSRNGQLLFYGGGAYLYDRLHQLMPGGGLFGLQGNNDIYAMQTILALPYPGNDSLYYVFYIEHHSATNYVPKLRYAIVNMNARNGLGVIQQKDILLLGGDSICVKLTAALLCNKQDIWLVGHMKNSDKYFSLLITPNGINAPVYSSCTLINESNRWHNHRGYMKISPLGDKLAAGFMGDLDMIEVCDFNNQTGIISNPKTINIKEPSWPVPAPATGANSPLGLEFSPSGKYLYASGIYEYYIQSPFTSTPISTLYQFDLTSNNGPTIQSSRILLDSLHGAINRGMQLAIDGKIYWAQYGYYLNAINNPEGAGASCNYVRWQVSFIPQNNWYDLPAFFQSYLRYPVITTGNCQFQNISFSVQNIVGVSSILWDFGDPASGINNTSTSFTPMHIFSQQGAYEVKAILYNANGCGADTIRKLVHAGPFQVYLGNDTFLCQGDTLTLRLSMSIPNANFLWNNNSMDTFIKVTEPGAYWVRANIGECVASDTINVTVRSLPAFTLGNDTLICSNQPISLSPNPNPSNVSYLWNTGAISQTINTNQAGIYWLRITENGYGCRYSDTINIQFKPLPNYSLGNDTSLCEKENLILDASVGGATSYLWSTGATTPTISISQSNIYWADVTKDQCVYRDSIDVLFKPLPIVNLGNDTTICEDQTVVLNAGNPGSQFQWQNNSTIQTFLVNAPGIYWVNVTSNGCSVKDTINITYDLKPVLNIGKDTTICEGMTIQLQPTIQNPQGVNYVWNNGATTPSIAITQTGIYGLTATNYCGSKSDEIIISKGVCKIYIPSAFTPNNDGLNDIFRVSFGENITKFRLQVYNRWGGIVFQTNDIHKGWDGKINGLLQSNGVYVWLIIYKTVTDSKEQMMRGTVTLIR
jgi:gliding motility-associated-like protein